MSARPDPAESATPLPAIALKAANSRAYLSAVFAAYAARRLALILPRGADPDTIPGLDIQGRRDFEEDWGWFEEDHAPIEEDGPAQIAFSSGTTGKPKAILLSHRALADVVVRINAAMGVDGTIREYVGVPVTFSFGLGRVRAVAAAGGASYLPRHGFDPGEIARMLEADEINAVSAVPTLWRLVLANPGVIGEAGRKVRWIEIGSQYMSAEEKSQMKRLFPNARIVQHYGLTEASRTTLLDISRAPEDRLESVGRAEGAVEIGTTPEDAIRIRGPHVAEGLVTEEGVSPVAGPDGWLVTSDRGRIEAGWLYYAGRLDELINVGGVKIDPTRFEERLVRRLEAPDDLAVARTADPLRGERVLVAYRDGSELDRDRVADAAGHVAEELGLKGTGAVVLRAVAEIPRTGTGKVKRAALADEPDLTAGPAATEVDDADLEGTEDPEARAALLKRIWGEALGISTVSLHESFYDLGGDSLSALTVILRMEAAGVDPAIARQIFDGRTIAEIAGLPAGAESGARTVPEPDRPDSAGRGMRLAEAMTAIHGVRGLLALWVVVVHWLPGVLERLPGAPVWIYAALEPMLRYGTPGFAIVFGLGIGALSLPQYRRSPEQFRAGNWLKARLVFGGVLVLAAMAAGLRLGQGVFWSDGTLGAMFYSAISYYALALLALPAFLALLAPSRHTLVSILTAMAITMGIATVLTATILPLEFDGPVQLAKLLAAAKYGFFRMSGYVLAGMALGYLFRIHHDRADMVRALSLAGVTIVALGLLLGQAARPGDIFADVGQVLPWHLTIYLGVTTLFLAGFSALSGPGSDNLPRPIEIVRAFLTASGILALPIFVGHELVLPAKALLDTLGVPGLVGLVLPLGLFLAALAIGYLRLLRMVLRDRTGRLIPGPDRGP